MKKEDVLWIHIPKTGGTSIQNLFNLERKGRAVSVREYPIIKSGRVHFQHGTLATILNNNFISDEFYDKAYIFTFVRNPYDRAVSHYFFSKANRKWGCNKHTTFKEYLEGPMQKIAHHGLMANFIMGYMDRIDFIGRFENFEADVRKVAEDLGDEIDIIPHENRSVRKPYQEMYTPKTKKILEDFYAEDFEIFGYDYEDW